MNGIGIICELNPPHAGHKLLFDFAREKADGRAVVAVMSGNFVQRGEPAVFQKHQRTAAALNAGVDLVLELPAPFALSSADGFAAAAVQLFAATGVVETLVFGAENGDLALLRRVAEALERPENAEQLRAELKNGHSYARACQLALEATLGAEASALDKPNNMLGIQYLRAINECGVSMEAVCLKREPGLTASGLRRELQSGVKAPYGLIPADYGEPVFPDNLELAMLSRLRILPESVFFDTPGGTDGIAERAVRFCAGAGDVAELARLIKTKRHTLSRVRRYLMCLVLGIKNPPGVPGVCPASPQYIRILGANATGFELLKSMDATLPIITKPADGRKLGGEVTKLLELEAAATDFYNLGYASPEKRRGGAEWKTSIVRM